MRSFNFTVTAFLILTLLISFDVDARKKKKKKTKDPVRPDVPALIAQRSTATLLSHFKKDTDNLVTLQRFHTRVVEHSDMALENNQNLYQNPNLQAYVNSIGQSLIPSEVSNDTLMTFKIIKDPVPGVYALSTGSVFLTTGMLSMLDNESQLAYVLAHEATHVFLNHHMYEEVFEAEQVRKGKRRTAVLGVLGAVAGALVSDNKAQGAAVGASLGVATSSLVKNPLNNRRQIKFGNALEKEADAVALELVMRRSYDPREAPMLIAKMRHISERSSPSVQMAFASDPKNLLERVKNVQLLLDKPFKLAVAEKLAGSGFNVVSPRFSSLLAELKRDNGFLALERDLFTIAKSNFAESEAIRSDDPATLLGLGLLYRAVGRTDVERTNVIGYFRAALRYDRDRNRHPLAHLHYAVELMDQQDPQLYPEIQGELKIYVALYQRLHVGRLPPEMDFVYDQLKIAGEPTWVALPVNNVTSDFPFQNSGTSKVDTILSSSIR